MSGDDMKPSARRLRDFLPLIVIFAVIILFTTVMILRLGYWDLMYAMRMFMGGFFVVFGGFKVLNWKGFAEAYRMYDIIAKRSMIYGYLYPLIELGLGISYFAAWNLLATNIITIVIMTIGAVGVGKELLKGEKIVCACLGVVFKIPMTWVTFIEDILMAGMALWMLFL